ncbi:cache domain-containing sensor histidine kinase [Lederbergia lenta]|uniref:Two-component sensor histidine kinase n=1 Tax=Lederbergia lenta TaxID=1467 RepID=A0A2X4WBV9_LEDLE|nr:sensor histidine kinase [Lederbergia lenta]MCM3110351.1 sensor histidine kinase [Lederbergia lenta]MEC2324081.1 sensor histidine kinase [Lederbergia lenta]SQI60651.1 two-component sensor histidine kinase [Lederbergia lenta]
MKAFIIRKFNDLKLKNKLMLSFVGVIFFPILIVGIFLTQELREIALNDALEVTQMNVDRVKKRTDELLKIPIYISNNLQFDSRLSNLTNEEYETIYDVVNAYSNYNDFQYYEELYPIVDQIYFYMDNPTMLNNWSFLPLDDITRKEKWYQAANEDNGLIRWFYLSNPTKGGNPQLSLVRKINFLEYKTSGMLVITIDQAQLNWILDQESSLTVIADENNYIVAANSEKMIGSKIDGLIDSTFTTDQLPLTLESEVNGESSQIIADYLLTEASGNQLKVISVVSTKQIVKDANRLSQLGATITVIAVFMAFLLISAVSWLLAKRISNLSGKINRVAEGDLETKLIIDGNDEIGQLSQKFNYMVANIRALIDQVKETSHQKNLIEKQQDKMKFKMLASQINPHFLFNTLESIRMKAHLKGEKEIADIVKLLGKLMRKNLETSGTKVRLKEEMEVVRCYLEIQKFRFEDRLTYDLQIEKSAEMVLIHPLIIQPLVENAIIHGLEEKEKDGKVFVKAFMKDDFLHVSIEDNGVGIHAYKIKKIYESLKEQSEKDGVRIGLRNVHQRLVLTYGNESGLFIYSTEGYGTQIKFKIPWEDKNVYSDHC